MNNAQRIVNHFLNNKTKKQVGQYATNGKVLVYIPTQDETRYLRDDDKRTPKDIIAVKFNNFVLGNSSVLRHVSFKEKSTETEIQRVLSEKITMVPFNVFEQAKLDLSKFELIEKGLEETVKQKILTLKKIKTKKGSNTFPKPEYETTFVDRHFTGACLFKIDKDLFLFDLDRREVKEGILNPFLVSLPDTSIKTIKDAYESLKPEDVKVAEKEGLKVLRQGEWFFIPTELSQTFINAHYKKEERNHWDGKTDYIYPELVLRAGQNRPNRAKMGFEAEKTVYVKGKISHTGREHADLELKGWHIAVPNTATKSWTVTGDID
jgi:hypothetical protein